MKAISTQEAHALWSVISHTREGVTGGVYYPDINYTVETTNQDIADYISFYGLFSDELPDDDTIYKLSAESLIYYYEKIEDLVDRDFFADLLEDRQIPAENIGMITHPIKNKILKKY